MTVVIEASGNHMVLLEEGPPELIAIEDSGAIVMPGEPIPPTDAQVRAALDAYFADNPAPGPAPEQVEAAVIAWLTEHPPADGDNATPEQVQAAVDAYLLDNPVDAQGPTPEQIATAVAAYLVDNPPDAGADATLEQIAFVVAQYMADHPVEVPEPIGPTPEQIATAVAAYLTENPPDDGDNATPEQIAAAVAAYLAEFPPEQGDNATPEQIATAVAAYMQANPAPGPTDMQVAAAVAAYLDANPPAADNDQVNALIDAYFSSDRALRESMKGDANGIATLDASGGLVQRMKIAAHSTPGIIRDAEGSGNGKAALYPASIAVTGETAIIIRTGVWQGDLDYAFRAFGTGTAGVINLSIFRIVRAGVPTYGYVNNGTVPVDVTFGMDGEGYSNWAIEGDFGVAQLVVTDNAVTGGGGDPQVRDWWASATSSRPLPLGSQVVVPRVSLA